MTTGDAQRRPIAIDLFAGVGGMSLGLEQAGFDVVGAVDIVPQHCCAYRYNFPQAKTLCADISSLTGAELLEYLGLSGQEVDLLAGGTPCQGFSLAGKRMLDDTRNALVRDYCRMVGEIKPRYALLENVAAMSQGVQQAYLHELVDELRNHGYTVLEPIQIIDAQDLGVAQRRKRIFILAARAGQNLPSPVTPTAVRTTVEQALMGLPDVDRFAQLLDEDEIRLIGKDLDTYLAHQPVDAGPTDLSQPRIWDREMLTGSLRTQNEEATVLAFSQKSAGTTSAFEGVIRLDACKVAPTLLSVAARRPLHPRSHRHITIREGARLHGYPDWFRFNSNNKTVSTKQLGNSVAPPVGKALGDTIVAALALTPRRPDTAIALGDPSLLALSENAARRYCTEIEGRPCTYRYGTDFSEQEIATIRLLRESGRTIEEISNAQRRSARHVANLLTSMGIEPPDDVGERHAKVIELRTQGMSHQDIADEVGLTPNGVIQICERNQVLAGDRMLETRLQVIALRGEKKTFKEIARITDMSVANVMSIWRKYVADGAEGLADKRIRRGAVLDLDRETRDARIIEMRKRGDSKAVIAVALGIAEITVQKACQRLGVSKKDTHFERRLEVIRLREEEKLSFAKIGERLKIHSASARLIWKKFESEGLEGLKNKALKMDVYGSSTDG